MRYAFTSITILIIWIAVLLFASYSSAGSLFLASLAIVLSVAMFLISFRK